MTKNRESRPGDVMTGCSCEIPRPETYDVEAPRGGLARIVRCIDCGAQEVSWLRPIEPMPAEAYTATPEWQGQAWPPEPRRRYG